MLAAAADDAAREERARPWHALRLHRDGERDGRQPGGAPACAVGGAAGSEPRRRTRL